MSKFDLRLMVLICITAIVGLLRVLQSTGHVPFANFIDLTTGLSYIRDLSGFLKGYTLALPYFKNMVAGNLLYGCILFGGFELARYRFPALARTSG